MGSIFTVFDQLYGGFQAFADAVVNILTFQIFNTSIASIICGGAIALFVGLLLTKFASGILYK